MAAIAYKSGAGVIRIRVISSPELFWRKTKLEKLITHIKISRITSKRI